MVYRGLQQCLNCIAKCKFIKLDSKLIVLAWLKTVFLI